MWHVTVIFFYIILPPSQNISKSRSKKLMYLIQNLDQIHSFLLTNFYLYFGTKGVVRVPRQPRNQSVCSFLSNSLLDMREKEGRERKTQNQFMSKDQFMNLLNPLHLYYLYTPILSYVLHLLIFLNYLFSLFFFQFNYKIK
jgi:hypothetical protein